MDITIIGAIVVGAVAIWALYKFMLPKADVNQDGKVDSTDAVAATTKVADVNHDGKIDVADAVEVVKKTTKKTKAVATKVAVAVKKPRAKKNG
jgi:Ca2+-binding EF-hand superfamily protein